jgi:hypothetical protein
MLFIHLFYWLHYCDGYKTAKYTPQPKYINHKIHLVMNSSIHFFFIEQNTVRLLRRNP